MPGRKEPFKSARIRESIAGPLEAKMEAEGFVGGFSAYVESVCRRYTSGLLLDAKIAEHEAREQIYAELAEDGLLIPPQRKRNHERNRKTG